MRIVVIHNRYQQAGGEDIVVQSEVSLLRAKGHEVEVFEENNDAIVSWIDAAKAACESVHSFAAAGKAARLIDCFRPEIAHIHNFFPLISPSVHYVCHEAKIPVVQTLHNYRLLCPGSTFQREGQICEECLGKAFLWPSVQHGCYRGSRGASAAVASMLSIHRALKTWHRTVSRFIAPTEFARRKFIEGGLPAEKIAVKANFVSPDPGMGHGNGGYALFVGRLTEEKGLSTLFSAWSKLRVKRALKIAGDGPLSSTVRDAAATIPGIEWIGSCARKDVERLMSDAAFLVCPSICYETFGLVLIEALAAGLPVLASRLGAMAEVVSDGKTGKLFTAGSSEELAEEMAWAFSHPNELQAMRSNARREYEYKYTAESSYKILAEIYRTAKDSQSDIHR